MSRDTWLQALSLQVRTQRLTLLLRGLYHRYWNQQRGSSSARDARRITPTATASYLVMRRPLWLYVRAGYQELFRMPTFTESYYYHLGAKTLRPRTYASTLGWTYPTSLPHQRMASTGLYG